MNNDNGTCLDYELELLDDFIDTRRDILIKHNYYSSNNIYGQSLLISIIRNVLSEKTLIRRLIVIDSGVLSLNNPEVLSVLEAYTDEIRGIYVSKESLDYYEADTSLKSITILHDDEMVEIIRNLENPIIIE